MLRTIASNIKLEIERHEHTHSLNLWQDTADTDHKNRFDLVSFLKLQYTYSYSLEKKKFGYLWSTGLVGGGGAGKFEYLSVKYSKL